MQPIKELIRRGAKVIRPDMTIGEAAIQPTAHALAEISKPSQPTTSFTVVPS